MVLSEELEVIVTNYFNVIVMLFNVDRGGRCERDGRYECSK